MKTIAILDTETTGLNPETDACIEVAVVLYSVEHAAPIRSFASLLCAPLNAAEDINRIPAALLQDNRVPASAKVWPHVLAMVSLADAIVAHRADFDRSFVHESVRNVRPWICSKFDIDWPRGKPGEHLVHLALAHGLGVAHAHRAMSDCDTLARLFQRVAEMGHDVSAMLVKAARPKKRYIAVVSYDDREKAKTAGFAWDGATKTWSRNMCPEDVGALDFQVREAS